MSSAGRYKRDSGVWIWDYEQAIERFDVVASALDNGDVELCFRATQSIAGKPRRAQRKFRRVRGLL